MTGKLETTDKTVGAVPDGGERRQQHVGVQSARRTFRKHRHFKKMELTSSKLSTAVRLTSAATITSWQSQLSNTKPPTKNSSKTTSLPITGTNVVTDGWKIEGV